MYFVGLSDSITFIISIAKANLTDIIFKKNCISFTLKSKV